MVVLTSWKQKWRLSVKEWQKLLSAALNFFRMQIKTGQRWMANDTKWWWMPIQLEHVKCCAQKRDLLWRIPQWVRLSCDLSIHDCDKAARTTATLCTTSRVQVSHLVHWQPPLSRSTEMRSTENRACVWAERKVRQWKSKNEAHMCSCKMRDMLPITKPKNWRRNATKPEFHKKYMQIHFITVILCLTLFVKPLKQLTIKMSLLGPFHVNRGRKKGHKRACSSLLALPICWLWSWGLMFLSTQCNQSFMWQQMSPPGRALVCKRGDIVHDSSAVREPYAQS